jgi:hypothetical protein
MGKKASGSQGRKRRAAAQAAAQAAQERRAASGQLDADLARYRRLGRPPRDPGELALWTARVTAEALFQTINDAEVDESTRRSQIAALADRAAKLHPRAYLEAQFKKIKATVSQYQQAGSAITVVPGSAIQIPPTARLAKFQRPAPRVVPDDPVDPLEGRGEVERNDDDPDPVT